MPNYALFKIKTTPENWATFVHIEVKYEKLDRSTRSALDRLQSKKPSESVDEMINREMMSDQPSKIGRNLPARRGKRCAHKGRKYQHNSLFKPSSCNICECDNGQVACENIQCDVLMCPVQVTPEGACCPICDDRSSPGDRPADIQGMNRQF